MRWRLPLAGTLTCALGVACASVLGLEELPLAIADAGGSDAPPSESGGGDAGCDARGPTFCQRICPVPDFCEDFEQEDPAVTWKPPPPLANPLVNNDGSVTVEVDDGGRSEGKVLTGRATGTGTNTTVALYTHVLAKSLEESLPIRGVRMKARLRVVELEFLAHVGGIPSERWAGAFALTGLAAGTEGVTVLLKEVETDHDYLLPVLSQRGIGNEGQTTDLIKLIDIERQTILSNPIELDVLVADKETFERESTCKILEPDASPTAPRALIQFLNQPWCAVLTGPLANTKWLEVPAIGAGIFVTEETRGEVRVDNIAVYLLW